MASKFLAVGTSGNARYSTDGSSWIQISGLSGTLWGVTHLDGTSVAINTVGTSFTTTAADFTSWTSHDLTATFDSGLYGVFADDANFYIVGGNGKLAKSANGYTLAAKTSQFGTTQINGGFVGDGLKLILGESGKLSSSTDGDTWVSRTSGFDTSHIYTGAYGNGVYIIGGVAGKIAKSTNGTTGYTLKTNPFSTNNKYIRDIAYNSTDGIWVAVGQSGYICTSNDGGETWVQQTSGTTDVLYAVSCIGGTYIAAGGGANSVVLKSTNAGVTWSPVTSGFGTATVIDVFAIIDAPPEGAGSSAGSSTVSGVSSPITSSAGSSAGASTVSGVSSLTSNFAAACIATNNNTADTRILFIGDSTTQGLGTTALTTQDYKYTSYPYQFKRVLSSHAIPASYDNFIGAGGSANWSNDARIVVGSGWSFAGDPSHYVLGGYMAGASSATSSFAFTPYEPFDTYRIYYTKDPSGGIMTVNIDGGANTNINTSGPSGIGVYEGTTTSGTHTINVNYGSGGQVLLAGIEALRSTQKQLIVYNAGVNSATTGEMFVPGVPYSPSNYLATLQPHLTIINLGINDAGTSVNTTTFQSNLGGLIDAAKAVGDVILMTPNPTSNINQTNYLPIIRALADTKEVMLFDLAERWVDYTTANANGYMYDTAHPNAVGAGDIAAAIYDLIAEDVALLDRSTAPGLSSGSSSVAGASSALVAAAGLSEGTSTVTSRKQSGNQSANVLLLLN